MSHFLGTHTNRIDAKGRVSIPAPFRAALRALAVEGAPPLVLRTSHKHACIECWPARYFEELAPPLESMDVFDDDHDDLAMALYPDAAHFDPDKEGRIALPEDLARHANLGETVFFMGLGRTFQIWEPVAAERARAAARERARFKRLTLRSAPPQPVSVMPVPPAAAAPEVAE
jgi:MraZ protein